MSVATPHPVVPSVRRMTVAEFAALSDSAGLELDGGIVLENDMGGLASWIGGRLHRRVDEYVDANHLGWAFPQETAFECFPPAAVRLRKPDTSFVRAGRFPGEQLPEGFIKLVPDLAAEVVSPNDTVSEVERKVRQYLAAGVRLVWVVLPETRDARVYRPGRSVSGVEPDGFLDGEDVLPGFRLPLADLFPPDPPAADPTGPI